MGRSRKAPSSSYGAARSTRSSPHSRADGVQSLLLEGGPTLAAAFLEHDLVDKLLVFQAPRISGEGEGMVVGLPAPIELTRLEARLVGDDVLLSAYVHEP